MPTSSRFHYRIIRPLFPGNNIIFTQFAYHCQALDSPHALPPPPSSLSFFISLPPRPTIIRPTITLLTRSIVSRNHQLVPRSYSYLLSLSLWKAVLIQPFQGRGTSAARGAILPRSCQ